MNVTLTPENPEIPPLGKVILYFPRFNTTQYPVWLPMEVMTIATALWDAGYQVRILDERMEPQAEEILLKEAGEALFVGSSARAGDQVFRTIELFCNLKHHSPHVTTVFGGWFPSTFPKMCLDIGPIDITVMGQGDNSVVELADRLRQGKGLKGLDGVCAKSNGEIIENPYRAFEDINETPRIPFDRFPIEQYVTSDHCVSYYTSRGCSGKCLFCAIPALYPELWSGYSAERVLDDMELLAQRFGVRIFKIHDTNFFPDFDRVRSICRGLIERNLNVRWVVDVRIYDILRFDDEMWDLLARSGCAELETGGETGSNRMLECVEKECRAEDIYQTALLSLNHGITIRFNFILGLYGESRKDLLATLRLIDRLQALGEQVKLQFFRYTPNPVTELGAATWKSKSRSHSGVIPRDIESIIKIPINEDRAELFWLSPAQERRVKRLYYFYLPLVYYYRGKGRSCIRRWILKRLIDLARFRVRRGITVFPFEQWFWEKYKGPLPKTREYEWQQDLC